MGCNMRKKITYILFTESPTGFHTPKDMKKQRLINITGTFIPFYDNIENKWKYTGKHVQQLKKILEEDPEAREEWNRTFKLKNDPRVTPIGKILRRTSLDELPQFFNVLKGDMSVVGPRPVVEEELKKYYKDKARYYLSVKPGVTGYWQVEGRSDVDNYEERVDMDVWYVQNQSFLLDLKIILKTIWVMFTGKGAY